MPVRCAPSSFLVPPLALLLVAAVALGACSSSDAPPPASPFREFTTFQPASLVIGQPDFATDDLVVALPTTIGGPYGSPAVAGGRLYLPDYEHARVLGFDRIPVTSGAAADFVLGQPDLWSAVPGVDANRFGGPQTVAAAGGRLALDEWDNNRILIWNGVPTTTGAPADVVVGQDAMTSRTSGCSATALREPESVHLAAGKLFVADSGNNRVLVYDSIPTANGQPADLVLGQVGMTSCLPNDPDGLASTAAAPTAATMAYPTDVWSDGQRVVVVDSDNDRILVWTSFPTHDGQAADVVLGQGSFGQVAANDDDQDGISDDGPTARTLSYPYFVDSNGVQLFVTDLDNNRVLVWNRFPDVSFTPADVVLGQDSFTASAENDDDQDGFADVNPSARTLKSPSGVRLVGDLLFVADRRNNRYVVFAGR